MSYRIHAPSAPDLDRRLAAARKRLESGDSCGASTLLSSVSQNLGRFYRDRTAMGEYLQPVLNELRDLSAQLPDEDRSTIYSNVAHL